MISDRHKIQRELCILQHAERIGEVGPFCETVWRLGADVQIDVEKLR